MAYWWVNHKKTGRLEVAGDYLWSPKLKSNGRANRYWDNMLLAEVGDIVFSFIGGRIGAAGVVTAKAVTAPKPDAFKTAGANWSNEGWYLAVSFSPVYKPLAPKDQISLIGPLLPAQYAPIHASGHGKELYLAAIPSALGSLLMQLTGVSANGLDLGTALPDAQSWAAVQDVQAIESSQNMSKTERELLVKARIGQGYFRSQVLLRGPRCRVTGVADKRLLRASHIKPWKDSNNTERLDGANGLMLSPHVDSLFDLGLISFSDAGRLLVRADLAPEVLALWSIPPGLSTMPFDSQQCTYLEHHRERLTGVGISEY